MSGAVRAEAASAWCFATRTSGKSTSVRVAGKGFGRPGRVESCVASTKAQIWREDFASVFPKVALTVSPACRSGTGFSAIERFHELFFRRITTV